MVRTNSTVLSEDMEQTLFISWFRKSHPNVLIFAVPNGGHRHKTVAAKMKATGTVRGVPDLFIPEWRIWVEMKRAKGGKLSPEQKGMIDYLQAVGYQVFVAEGHQAAIEFIKTTKGA
jgi:hypothetical protein